MTSTTSIAIVLCCAALLACGQVSNSDVDAQNVCEPNPCENQGACMSGPDGFVCMCTDAFTGPRCQTPLDPCDPDPCQNGGACTSEAGATSCECLPGFTGDLCEINIDECMPNPCENGGRCIDGIAEFMCECGPDHTGPTCSEPVCTPTPISMDFTNQGTFQTATIMRDGLLITGSNTLNVLNLNGLGVVGGVNDSVIDGNEFVVFTFPDRPATEVSYSVQTAGNQNGDGMIGAAVVEGFGPNGQSLGIVSVQSTGQKNVSAFFNNVPLSQFRVQAVVDNHRISRVNYTLCL